MFTQYIGIDYSGRGTCSTRTSAIQVYLAEPKGDAIEVKSPASTSSRKRNWCREEVAYWLLEQIQRGEPIIAGIDHGFSLPQSYMNRFGLTSWNQFLLDFCDHWPTNRPGVSVDDVRKKLEGLPGRIGKPSEYRMAERWTSSAKSVFQFDIQGSVAKSTHAGIPWVQMLRKEAGDRIHCWPFDGWEIPKNRSVITEVFPSIFRQRYPRENRNADAQDAYSVARWLAEADQNHQLQTFFEPFLTGEQRKLANIEGWILGII